jgi:ElaB/YqjD/DUF883 family membrane-anchored ribosome-binding protein
MISGSIMRKWDLHIHTPESYENQYGFSDSAERESYGGDLWKKYVDELEKINDISVVGITDYFSIDGYKRIIEEKAKGRLQNFALILPNIELRLDKFVGTRRLNYHIIFSDNLSTDIIENEFLASLDIVTATGEKRSLRRTNVETIGKTLRSQQKEFKTKSDYYIGCMNITVSLENIIDILREKKSIFDGKYLLVLAESDWSSIKWDDQDHLTRKNILVRSHAIFSSNENTRKWALGKDTEYACPDDFVKEFGSLKPCIHGSDAHCFEKLCKPDEDRFCWIKADPTFEGLKQIVCEPDERVKVTSQNPEYKKNIYSLHSVKINETKVNEELTLSACNLSLSSSLVTVIGGKGSGKTALLDLIANCFENRCYRNGNTEDKNSFVQRIEADNPDLHIELEFIGTDIERFNKRFTDEKLFKDVNLTYLPQGQIEEFSGNREKLNNKIQEIIFNSEQVINAKCQNRFEILGTEIQDIKNEIDNLTTQIFQLEQESTPQITKRIEDHLSTSQGELHNKEVQLQEISKKVATGTETKVKDLRKLESELNTKHSKIETFQQLSKKVIQQLESFPVNMNYEIDSLNQQLTEFGSDKKIHGVDFTNQLDVINKAIEYTKALDDEVSANLKVVKEEIGKLEGIEKTQADLLGEITRTKDEIIQLESSLKELKEKRQQIKQLEIDRINDYCQMINKYLEWKKYYKEVIEIFSAGSSEIMSGITFESSIHFDRESFIDLGSDILDMRSVTATNMKELADILEEVVSQDTDQKIREKHAKFVEKITSYKSNKKGKRPTDDFNRWLFSNYFSLDTQIFFNGVRMDKLSIGQKGTILLKLFLAEGDYPLVADMPEENLDNKFIYDELRDAFRQAKTKRQLLIATNNANLVVNADAEQVIVAEYKDNIISYRSGSIEDLTIRKEMKDILEGGPEALRKREQKYDI